MNGYSRAFVLSSIVVLFLLSQQASPQDQEPISPDEKEVMAHLIGEMPVIRADLSKFSEIEATAIPVEVSVDEQGNVTSASLGVDDADDADLSKSQRKIVRNIVAEAKKVGMTLHFRPFEKDGHPAPAQFDILMPLHDLKEQAAKQVPFPRIHNWNSVKIVLSRTGCFGRCPSYSVEVHGDGTVFYAGGAFVAINGAHRHSVSGDAVLQMVEAFRAANYFSLQGKYMLPATDLPTYTTSISFDGKMKEVVDYAGEGVGMPESVSKLEEAIDHLSGVERWTKGNKDTVPALIQEKFDFKSAKASEILANVAQMGDDAAVRDLVAAGVVVSAEPAQQHFGMPGPALGNAAHRGDVEALRLLLSAGIKDPNAKTEALTRAAHAGKIDAMRLLIQSGANPVAAEVLIGAASSGIPAVVQEILKYKPDPNSRGQSGTTALIAGVGSYRSKDQDVNVKEVVRLLVEAGADPNIADDEGKTPLIANWQDVEIARLLLAHGANVNARARDGFTPLLNADNADLTRLLLEHGADPFAKTEDGETALDLAKQGNRKDQAALLQAAMSGEKQ